MPQAAPSASTNNGHTLLLAEDDDVVRDLTVRMLKARGYTVLAAPDGATALALAEQHREKVDLLVTDVVMPTMSGSALGARLAATMPDLKILYVSGYLAPPDGPSDLVNANVAFLGKPFTADELASKIRELIGGAVPCV